MKEPFREELERWARRPPERLATVARGRVLARMESRRAGLPWKLPVTALLLAGLALGVILGARRPQPTPREAPDQSVVVFQLQSGTKVYFVMKGDPS
jgi:hypothetical protein